MAGNDLTVDHIIALARTVEDSLDFDRELAVKEIREIFNFSEDEVPDEVLSANAFVSYICGSYIRNLNKVGLQLVDMKPKTKGNA